MCLKNRHYISAQILEITQIPQKRRLIEPHVNAAVINTSIPSNEIFFAQIENNVKGRGKTNGNLLVAIWVMQNVIACSTKTLWTTIRANYVARHISAQILPIENLFECNSHRKHSADSQIQTENLFVFISQLKQFVDVQTQSQSFHRKNQNVFNFQTQTFISTADCDVQVNSAIFRRGNRLKRRQSQNLRHSTKLRAKLLKRYADLRDG